MRSSHWRWSMIQPHYMRMESLRVAAQAYIRRWGRPEYRHTHTGMLQWMGPVVTCYCGGVRDARGFESIDDAPWIVTGAAQYTIEQAETGNRLAQRALAGQYQYAR